MVSKLEADILSTIGEHFFMCPVYGIKSVETEVKCPICYGNKSVSITYKLNAYMIKCPKCNGNGVISEDRFAGYSTYIKSIDITLNASQCMINNLELNTLLDSSYDIIQMKYNLMHDLYNMWMEKWYHNSIYYIKETPIHHKCSVCFDTRHIEFVLRGQLFEAVCPECLNKRDTIKFEIIMDSLRSARFVINADGIKENLGYWADGVGQVTPYFTYDAAVEAKDKKLRGE